MSTFLLNVPPTEILATPLQYSLYRAWEELMYEILYDVLPSNQNVGAATVYCILISCHMCFPNFYTWRTICYAHLFIANCAIDTTLCDLRSCVISHCANRNCAIRLCPIIITKWVIKILATVRWYCSWKFLRYYLKEENKLDIEKSVHSGN